MTDKPRIAHLAGSNATIQNSPPLVTSNKARRQYGLAPLTGPDGDEARFDVLRPQRLAAPVTVYVEQFSAHPLEHDAAELYGPPDGYLDADRVFHETRQGPEDVAVYRVELSPDDGLYPLPYMARQSDGSAWEDDCAFPGAPAEKSRQAYYPDGSRIFEEIDRFGISDHGTGNMISSRADMDFYRVLPSGGYTKGQSAADRTDLGEGDIPPERLGRDFFAYRPVHLAASPPRPSLARITNMTQRILASGDYQGAIWTQGSPRVEETVYWLNLLIDTTVPICGNAAQRTHGEISNDGPKNLVNSVEYIASRIWADADGRDRVGAVLIQEQQIFSSRDVQKGDARPGGYVATGGHGGILGTIGYGPGILTYLPAARHTYRSEVNITRLPAKVDGIGGEISIKDSDGYLLDTALPKVSILKDGNYTAVNDEVNLEREVDIVAQIEHNRQHEPLCGFVVEGQSPYGSMTNDARAGLMLRAVRSGMPVARVGRGNADGFTDRADCFIGGRNLTSSKARLLLMACLMRFGAPPAAADPDRPTEAELNAIRAKVDAYQQVFDTH